MIELVGRQRERKELDRLLTTGKAEFLVVYGRRRVGKTFLIREYFKKDLVFDFTGANGANKDTQLNNFFDIYLASTKGQRETKPPQSWSEAFRYLAGYLSGLRKNKRKSVVFIDELPWLDAPRSRFVSAFEYFWNQHVSRMDHILLVGCGSATSWIRKKIFASTGGLYNRVTKRMKLEPFTLAETESYCKSRNLRLSRYQIIQLYMVMGGIPFYLDELRKGKSATQMIDEICFTPTGILATEYDILFKSLFRNPTNHIELIEVLGKKSIGLTRNDLIKATKLSEGGTISRALEELESSGFITRYIPFQKKKKDTLYKICDPYTLFYIRFIKPSTIKGKGAWISIMNTGTFRAWSGYAYEMICMNHIDKIKRALGISGIYSDVCSWKYSGNDEYPGAQIDVLIDRADQVINLCEVKFTDKEFIIDKAYNNTLRKKRSVFEQVTKSKKTVFTTLITTYPAIQNKYYLEEVQSEVSMDALFEN